jgi:hypothetical protein
MTDNVALFIGHQREDAVAGFLQFVTNAGRQKKGPSSPLSEDP